MSFIPHDRPKQYILFDKLAEEMWYGAKFRNTLASNPKAMEAAQTLVDALEASRSKNSEISRQLNDCPNCVH